MASIRLIFLWHMHQPFYKDLVTGEYRLPWVRMHALKDYYGMVKLLDEFPLVHQNFNLVPSLVTQINDYVAGTAKEAWRDLVQKPASELSHEEKKFALTYLFQANHSHQVGRYPRYFELWQKRSSFRSAEAAIESFSLQDFTDLQVLSQIAWFDEFFLESPQVAALIEKGRDFSSADQEALLGTEGQILASVVPAYRDAAKRGGVELSTTPFYHPILPLLCDSNNGRVSSPGLPLPRRRFLQTNDALEQMRRALDFHEHTFGERPAGMWPSEGSVSNEVLALARQVGLKWLATDEGVLGRSTQSFFERNGAGTLTPGSAQHLYRVYRHGEDDNAVSLFFRDHNLSDLIGFVYSGMEAKEAAAHFVKSVKASAEPVLASGRDAVVSVILDGENAWEHFPQSGREFLRRLYDAIQSDSHIEPLTISEVLQRAHDSTAISSLVPGSWINANFNVWIGAPEDNLAWDYLAEARDFYARNQEMASEQDRQLAYEELLIAEGSDWNWWYGPEHHSANDRDFDELYRKHLSNVYLALGGAPPDVLAQPIAGIHATPQFTPQTTYIHPAVDGRNIGYFEWLGAASHVADRHSSAMHGRLFLLDTGYAGIDEQSLYCRVDFIEPPVEWATGDTRLVVAIETVAAESSSPVQAVRLEVDIAEGILHGWTLTEGGQHLGQDNSTRMGFASIFECQIPLKLLKAGLGSTLRVRFSVWRDGLPLDALPQEGAIDVLVAAESELSALPYAKP